MKTIDWMDRSENLQPWQTRHLSAIKAPRRGLEASIVLLIYEWIQYAIAIEEEGVSPIGQDSVLGPAWAAIGQGLHRLLDGPIGKRLDQGTLSTIICDNLVEQGVPVEEDDE